MRPNIPLLLLLSMIAITTYAQTIQSLSLNIGDPVPPLRVREWLKGTPVQQFEKGNVYVLEFWATWCGPCITAMPHLSVLAGKYKDKVTVIGIDTYEKKTTSPKKVKAFVDSMGHRMDYRVAAEDSNFMSAGWLDASGEQGIPRSFVVNAEGRLAWIGNPNDLDEVLPKIINNTWDLNEALTKRNFDRHLEILDSAAGEELKKYVGDWYKQDYLGKPDSGLLVINEMVKNEPALKYAPTVASYTFSFLLLTNPHKAYEFGKVVMVTSTYQDPPYNRIISSIEDLSVPFDFPKEIYELCAEAHQLKIDRYYQTINIPNTYRKMGDWYVRAGDKSKAIDAQQKAIEALKSKKDFPASEMAALESCLQQYRKM